MDKFNSIMKNIIKVVKDKITGIFNNKDYKLKVNQVYMFLWKLLHRVVVFGVCFIIIQPILQKISTSFMALDDVFDVTVAYIPANVSTIYIKMVYKSMDYFRTLFNSTTMCLLIACTQVFACSFVAYGFARFKFIGNKLIFGLLIFTMIVPPTTILIPQYINFKYFDIFNAFNIFTGKKLNLINTYWPFILTSLTAMGFKNGLYVYLIRQYFRSQPRDIEDAARIDGCGSIKTYFTIMLPGAKPILTASFLFSFVWQWTDAFFISYYAPDLQTVSTKLTSLVGDINYTLASDLGYSTKQMVPLGYEVAIGNTGVLFVILPLVLIYIYFQRFFTESIELTGIK